VLMELSKMEQRYDAVLGVIPNSQVRVRHLPDKFHSSGRDK
jgi:hypothetical protein